MLAILFWLLLTRASGCICVNGNTEDMFSLSMEFLALVSCGSSLQK